jgi:hypothetical protein
MANVWLFSRCSVQAFRRPAPVRDDLTFTVEGLFGAQLLGITNMPKGWILKSVRYNGVDITDTPVQFTTSSDASSLQIALTDRSAVLSGRVVDDRDQAVTGASVILFPADPQRRRPASTATTPSADDGSFTIGDRRAGEYLIVAVHEDEAPRFGERMNYELLAKAAERVSLYEGARGSITLRLVKLREAR